MPRTVVLLKTHVWSSDLAQFVSKIYRETSTRDIMFYVLMHDQTKQLHKEVSDPLIAKRLICFTEEDIRSTYNTGFDSMWLSNHWILSWFFKRHPTFDYYWSIEYDVRISGDSGYIWAHTGIEDFLYVRGGYQRPNHKFINKCTPNIPTHHKRFGYLQLARYSQRALAYLDQCHTNGINGQDELIVFTLIFNSNLTHSCKFLGPLVRGMWTWMNEYSASNRFFYEQITRQHLRTPFIFHPVK